MDEDEEDDEEDEDDYDKKRAKKRKSGAGGFILEEAEVDDEVEEEDDWEDGAEQYLHHNEMDEHGPTAREIEGSLRRHSIWESVHHAFSPPLNFHFLSVRNNSNKSFVSPVLLAVRKRRRS